MSTFTEIEARVVEFLREPAYPDDLVTRFRGGSPFFGGADLADLTRDELLRLIPPLTRVLRFCTYDDHYRLWAWSGHALWSSRGDSPLFGATRATRGWDRLPPLAWPREYCAVLQLMLARNFGPHYGSARLMGTHLPFPKGEFNVHAYHALEPMMAETIVGPICFSLLEGALRRVSDGLDNKGKVVATTLPAEYRVAQADKAKAFDKGKSIDVNQVKFAFMFYRDLVARRGRGVAELAQLEHSLLFWIQKFERTATDAIEAISSWRNETLHGEHYWDRRVHLLLMLLSFLALDSLDGESYDARRDEHLRARSIVNLHPVQLSTDDPPFDDAYSRYGRLPRL